jgi:hypothetical protein
MRLYVFWQLLTMKPRGMRWRRWLRLNRVVQRALRDRRLSLAAQAATERGGGRSALGATSRRDMTVDDLARLVIARLEDLLDLIDEVLDEPPGQT